MIHAIHDNGYKRLFANHTLFRQLIQTFVPEAWVAQMDFEQCEKVDKSFVSEHYKETESDMIYKVKFAGSDAYLFVLLEFQSSVDQYMALRMLNYITNFYMDRIAASGTVTPLPPVFPILLYNKKAQWTAARSIAQLIAHVDILGKYAPQFEYLPIIEQSYPISELFQISNLVSTLFLVEIGYDRERVKQELLRQFRAEPDRQAVNLLLNWVWQLAERGYADSYDVEAFARGYHAPEEVVAMLDLAFQDERTRYLHQGIEQGHQQGHQQGMQQGIQQGMQQGIQEGKWQERRQIARDMLANGLEIALIAKITQVPEAEIRQMQAEAA